MDLEITIDIPDKDKELYVVAGLPGMGFSGKQAVDHLIKVLDVEKVARIETPYLNPPAVSTVNGVVDDIIDEVFTVYYAEKDGKSLILFTGNVQPMSSEWQHIMSKALVDSVKAYQVSAIFTLAATPIETYKYEASVYGVATTRQFLNELMVYGVIPMEGQGGISGMNGLIIGYAKYFGLKGASLLAETFLKTSQDYIAPYALLRKLSKILKIEIDLSELEYRRNMFHEEYIKHLREMGGEEGRGLGYIS